MKKNTNAEDNINILLRIAHEKYTSYIVKTKFMKNISMVY